MLQALLPLNVFIDLWQTLINVNTAVIHDIPLQEQVFTYFGHFSLNLFKCRCHNSVVYLNSINYKYCLFLFPFLRVSLWVTTATVPSTVFNSTAHTCMQHFAIACVYSTSKPAMLYLAGSDSQMHMI